jgi:mono/diheme cytochrome c family protein
MVPFHLFLALILLIILRRHASAPGRRLATFVFPFVTALVSVSGTDLLPARGDGLPGNPVAAGLFRRLCQRCHGADGAGKQGKAADNIPDFTRRAFQEQRDDAELSVSILEGKGTGMPPFQDRLSESQTRGLVAHIRAQARGLVGRIRASNPAPPEAPAKSRPSARIPGNDFVARSSQLEDEFEDLQRQERELNVTRQRQPKPPLGRGGIGTLLLNFTRQLQPKPPPRAGESRTRPGEGAPGAKRTGMESSTHNQASSTVAGHRRASAEDRQEPKKSAEVAARIHALFSAKCTECHGANLRKPKGKFGYVLDLERVRGNRKMVVPSRPDESKLWTLIRDNEMPPEDSTVGSLTAEDKGLVRDWIAAGAPAALPRSSSADGDPPSRAADPSPPPAAAPPSLHRLLGWLGRFHIPAIHFPIALFLAAAAGDLWCLWWRIRDPWPPIRFCVLLGAGGSAFAAGFGWLHADFGGYGAGSSALLGLHRWLGTLGSCSAAGAAVISEIDSRRRHRSLLFHLVLFAAVLLIGAAGHFGGSLVHGDDFFTW